jgi:hypothetical protein
LLESVRRALQRRFRKRRSEHLRQLLAAVPKPYSILDVGGAQQFWEQAGIVCGEPGVETVVLNVELANVTAPGMRAVVGSATAMPEFADDQFDLVFSNSVIEHVGGPAEQQRMADEVRRIGRRYYVQTPSRYFPIEPHFVFPFFALLPVSVRVFLVQHFALGWNRRIPDRAEAEALVCSVRLLTRRELQALFPDARLARERVAGLTKSYTAYGGAW